MGHALSQRERAAHFGGFALAKAAQITSELSGDELLCPFVVVTKGDSRQMINFEAESQAEAVERGKASLSEFRDQIDSWAFAREGLQSSPHRPEKNDVLRVSCWVSGMSEPLMLVQGFSPAQTGNFKLFGPIEIVEDGRSLSPNQAQQLRCAVEQGIHSGEVPWERWSAHDA